MKVKELMTADVAVATEGDKVEQIVRMMVGRGIGCVPIVNESGGLVGIITNSDLIPKQYRGPFETKAEAYLFGLPVLNGRLEDIYESVRQMTAGEVMTSPVITVSEEDEIQAAFMKMIGNDVNHLPVERDGVLVGILSRHDLLSMAR